jgi:hypothetical protein
VYDFKTNEYYYNHHVSGYNMKIILLFSLVAIALYIIISNSSILVDAQSTSNSPSLSNADSINNNSNPFASITNTFNNFNDKFLHLGKQLEYTQSIDANQIFANETIKHKILNNLKPTQYAIPILKYRLMGFDISATDIEVKTISTKIQDGGNNKTRIDFPIMKARNVKVSNGGLINLSYEDLDLSSTYVIYNPNTEKFTLHIPISVAARYLPKGF